MKPRRILITGVNPVTNGVATHARNIYPHVDTQKYIFDFLFREDMRDDADRDRRWIEECGGRIFFLDYNVEGFSPESRIKLKELLLSEPEIRGVHVHYFSFFPSFLYPLTLADELGLPIKAIQFHIARGKNSVIAPQQQRRISEWVKPISGSSFIRLACSDLAGQYAYPGLSFSVIPNAVDTDRISYNPVYRKLVRAQLGISDSTAVLGFVANIHPFKNATFALQVFAAFHKLHPDSIFLMLGHNHADPKFQSAIDENEIRPHVRLLYIENSADMFYSAMDIIINTSFYEGLPYNLVEAQAAALPCLISDQVSDMVEITPFAHRCALKEPPQIWAKKVLQILNSHSQRYSPKDAICAAGYDVDSAAKKLQDIYDMKQ